jgi:hypothetical protein
VCVYVCVCVCVCACIYVCIYANEVALAAGNVLTEGNPHKQALHELAKEGRLRVLCKHILKSQCPSAFALHIKIYIKQKVTHYTEHL